MSLSTKLFVLFCVKNIAITATNLPSFNILHEHTGIIMGENSTFKKRIKLCSIVTKFRPIFWPEIPVEITFLLERIDVMDPFATKFFSLTQNSFKTTIWKNAIYQLGKKYTHKHHDCISPFTSTSTLTPLLGSSYWLFEETPYWL